MYETFEHTADLGLRVLAATREELFTEAAHGLTSMLIEETRQVRPQTQQRIELKETDDEYLLFDWLNELLFLHESEHLVFCEFEVCFAEDGLTAHIRGEPVASERHRPAHEVKATTYHGLSIDHSGDGWVAELIVDI